METHTARKYEWGRRRESIVRCKKRWPEIRWMDGWMYGIDAGRPLRRCRVRWVRHHDSSLRLHNTEWYQSLEDAVFSLLLLKERVSMWQRETDSRSWHNHDTSPTYSKERYLVISLPITAPTHTPNSYLLKHTHMHRHTHTHTHTHTQTCAHSKDPWSPF